MLEVRNLTKIYDGGVLALDNVSFSVEQGEFLAVIGLSGSGKSTLLRCINRLVEPTEGQILWNGVDITTASQDELLRIRRRIGMVFQHFNLVTRSKVITNVLAGRLGYVNTGRSIRADELSGGQQQRVGIARAMVQEPEMILADEPVASLDPVLAHSIMQHLDQINKEDGATVLCSLHFLDLVHEYADRAIALNDGLLMFDGTPEAIDDEKFKEIYGKEAERVG
jgi:phosphonate transport system ATP-binding protein